MDQPGFFNRLQPRYDLVPEALEPAMVADISVHDRVYAAASRHAGANLVTADRRLIAKLAGTPDGSKVTHIADWR